MTGTLFGATMSYGCGKANMLGITPMLKEYSLSGGKNYDEKEIRIALKKLLSFLYYQLIAIANGIDDPFDLRVIKAHWIGNEFLENIKPNHIKQLLGKQECDEIIFAYTLEPVIRGKLAHHNNYAANIGKENCKVTIRDKYIYHLMEKRILATPEDFENLIKYGRK